MSFTTRFRYRETNMFLKTNNEFSFSSAKKAVLDSREELEGYLTTNPEIARELEVRKIDFDAPGFVRKMMEAGQIAGVGMMASVAGGLSQIAAEKMMQNKAGFAIAVNGGDTMIIGEHEELMGVFAGTHPLSEKIGFKVKDHEPPLGICSSAGAVGHSISLGEADAVVVFSRTAFLSDAAATGIANVVSGDGETGVQLALERSDDIPEIRGCVVFYKGMIGKTGKIPEIIRFE